MKWSKRCGAAILAAAMFLTGCAATPQGGGNSAEPLQAKGRFVEEAFAVTDGTHTAENGMLFETPAGKLVVLQLADGEEPGRWDSEDGGKSWTYTPMPWAEECAPLQDQDNLAVEDDGSLLVATREPALYRVDAQGGAARLPVKELEGFAPLDQLGKDVLHCAVDYLIPLKDGGFYLQTRGYYMSESYTYQSAAEGSGAGFYNADGSRRKAVQSSQYGTAVPAGDRLLLVDWDGHAAVSYDAATEEMQESAQLPADLEALPVCADAAGNLYFFSSRGIQRLAAGSSVLETILDGETYSFGTPTATLMTQAVLDAEHLILSLVDDQGQGSFYRYTYDPEAPVGASTTLRVWALEDNDVLRLAVNVFRRQHPEVRVQLELALAGAGATADDAVRTLNTELLAGKGPDVLILDGVPAESFAKNGLLADLTPYVDLSALYEPFRNPFATEQGVFYLPTLFHLNVLAGRAEDVDGIRTPMDLAQAVADGPAMWDVEDTENYQRALPREQQPTAYFESLESLFELLWSSGAPAILTQDGVDDAALEALLNACKTISDHDGLVQGHENTMSMGFGTNTLFYDIPNELVCYMYDSARLGAATVKNLPLLDYPVQFHFADGMPKADADTALRLFPGFTEGAYQPVLLAGVSAAGTQQELAGAFVAAMLGTGVQDQPMPGGLPTTKAGVAAQIERENQKYADQMEEIPEGMAHGRYMADAEGLIAQLKTPVLVTRSLTQAVRDAVDAYCTGTQTLEEAMTAVRSAVNLYLAEQK